MPTVDYDPRDTELRYGGNRIPVHDARISYPLPRRPAAQIFVHGRPVAEGEYQDWSGAIDRFARSAGISAREASLAVAEAMARDRQSTERMMHQLSTLYGPTDLRLVDESELARAARQLEEQGKEAFRNQNLGEPWLGPSRWAHLDSMELGDG